MYQLLEGASLFMEIYPQKILVKFVSPFNFLLFQFWTNFPSELISDCWEKECAEFGVRMTLWFLPHNALLPCTWPLLHTGTLGCYTQGGWLETQPWQRAPTHSQIGISPRFEMEHCVCQCGPGKTNGEAPRPVFGIHRASAGGTRNVPATLGVTPQCNCIY